MKIKTGNNRGFEEFRMKFSFPPIKNPLYETGLIKTNRPG